MGATGLLRGAARKDFLTGVGALGSYPELC